MKYAIVLLTMIIINSCNKDKPSNNNPGQESCYQKFIGNYKVYDTDSNIYYNMTITKQSSFDINGIQLDTLILSNFAKLFNLRTQFICTADSASKKQNFLSIGAHDSIFDFAGHQWYLFPLFQDSLGNKMSWLENDTLNLYFNMCNIKFYINEGQPYFCKNVLHLAVKQH